MIFERAPNRIPMAPPTRLTKRGHPSNRLRAKSSHQMKHSRELTIVYVLQSKPNW